MFCFLKKKNTKPAFEVNSPKISITPDIRALIESLKASDIEYTPVTDGYITFAGQAFASDIPLMFGVHFNKLKVKFIEVFRPLEYYQSDCYDINESFEQLSKTLRKQYGKPLVTTSASIGGYPCEQWLTQDFIVNHYIIDRFGPEEHLHINFYKK